MSVRLFILLGLLIGSATAAASLPPALQDQYGVTGGLAQYAGQPVLVIVASGRQLRWIGQWERALRKELPQLVSLRIADIRDDPPPTEAEVAEVLRQRAPPGISILIDMQNAWAQAFALDTAEPCLVLLNGDHATVTTFRGRPREPLYSEVIAALRPWFPAAATP